MNEIIYGFKILGIVICMTLRLKKRVGVGFLIFHHVDGEHHAEGGLLREDLRQAKSFYLLYS